MADRQTQIRAPPQSRLGTNSASFLQKLHDHAPMGVLTLVVSGAVLLLLTGASVALTVLGLVFFVPIIVLSSPLWVPLAAVFFFVAAGFISVVGFGVAAVAGFSWLYRYVRGLHPPGSDRVDYARSRLFDTASHVKDYAREYGGYLQSKVKDAAPGA